MNKQNYKQMYEDERTNTKFELTSETKAWLGTKLFRIKALIEFGNVKKGELGGYIEKENNLNSENNAWVSGNAQVSGNARVYGNAWVSGNARVYGDARVQFQYRLSTGYINKKSDKIEYQLASQLGILPVDNKLTLYKRVNKISKEKYKSVHDSNFIYEDGKIAEVKDYDKSTSSCTRGIHLSNPLYWNEGDTLISCEVAVKDIITVQEGKVRCKKCKCLGEVKL